MKNWPKKFHNIQIWYFSNILTWQSSPWWRKISPVLIRNLLIWSQLTFSSNFQSQFSESPIPDILRVFAPNASIWFVLTAETNFVSSSHISLPPFTVSTIFSLSTDWTSAKFSFPISRDLSSGSWKKFYWKDHGHGDHAETWNTKLYVNWWGIEMFQVHFESSS